MIESPAFHLSTGFSADQTPQAAMLFWDAFKGKLGLVMRPENKALDFLRAAIDPSHAVSAASGDGRLLGVAGFKTDEGAFVGGSFREIAEVYGALGGAWRGLALSLLERPVQPGVLLMDGVCVERDARGRGVGSALLSAVKAEARSRGCGQVRLDVIDTNARARALYEREGFVATETAALGPLRLLFGFRSVTTMIHRVA